MFTIVTQRVQRIVPWLERQARRAGSVLFAGSDRRALIHGWEIIQRGRGLSRTYRDPRFHQLSRCYQCGGTGVSRHSALRSCFICWGTGRLTETSNGLRACSGTRTGKTSRTGRRARTGSAAVHERAS